MVSELGMKVVIAVHREELLKQTKKQIEQKLGFTCGTVSSDSQLNRMLPIQVVMVETINRRKKDLQFLQENYDILIIDECHIGNFVKIMQGFKRIIGFSATPVSSKKSTPLAKYYKNLHYPVQIADLVNKGFLCKPDTWVHPEAIDKKDLKVDATGLDYDLNHMGEMLSSTKYVETLTKYVEKFCKNKRTIIYNANISHSLAVTSTLKSLGYNVYHLDGETSQKDREIILGKLMTQTEIIVCNVGVLTTGFDCPEVEVIILNRRTKSLSLYIQMAGRGSRISEKIGKTKFTILDMCNNYEEHNGAWHDEVDWNLMFNKLKKKKAGPAPQKQCKQCGYINPLNATNCEDCGAMFEKNNEKEKSETDPNLILLGAAKFGNDDFTKMIRDFKARGKNTYYSLRKHIEQVINDNMDLSADSIIGIINQDLPQWCKVSGIRLGNFQRSYVYKTVNEIHASKHL